ncbi:MAG: PEGA domain-containing protein [Lentisphaerae bacterium]|jgi:hypothetical protein|nr:PEGA domain-containing protein [Lentisphaerota bacterium]
MKLRVIKGSNPGELLAMDGDTFTIGREEDNQFVIPEAGVSRHHCRFSRIDGDWLVEDLHSVNGVLVNGVKVDGGMMVKVGDEITVFSHQFRLEDDAATPEAKPVFTAVSNDVVNSAFPEAESPVVEAGPESGKKISNGLMLKLIALLVLLCAIGVVVVVFLRKADGGKASEVERSVGVTEENLIDEKELSSLKPSESVAPPVEEVKIVEEKKAEADEKSAEEPAKVDEVKAGADVEPEPEGEVPAAVTQPALVSAPNLLVVRSVPSDAEVLLDGEAVGATPLVLKDLKEGRHTLELSSRGYEKMTRQLQIPEREYDKTYKLVLKPGTIEIVTRPAAAEVWLGRKLLGTTPLLLENFAAGNYEFTLASGGCEKVVVPLTLTEAKGEHIEKDLPSILGSLKLQTTPASCKIFVDGAYMGTSVVSSDNAHISEPFLVENLNPGWAYLKVLHSSGKYDASLIQIKKGEMLSTQVAIWLPTHRLTKVTGEAQEVMLLKEGENGDVVVTREYQKPEQVFKPQISKLEKLEDSDIAEYVRQRAETKRPGESGPSTKSQYSLTAADFASQAKRQEFVPMYGRKMISLTGQVTGKMKDRYGAVILNYTTAIRCYMVPGFSTADLEEVDKLIEAKRNVSIRGLCEGIRDNTIIMSNCICISEPD